MRGRVGSWVVVLLSIAAANVLAATPVTVPKKLIIVDKLFTANKVKFVYVVKDDHVTKGVGTDPDDISARFDFAYEFESARGAFTVPAGASANQSPGWVVNSEKIAKYVNREAPAGPTGVKLVIIKPGRLIKLVGTTLGDEPLDILEAGKPGGAIFLAFCVTNGGEEDCHCSRIGGPDGCAYRSIADGTGAKLTCRAGAPNDTCDALSP